MPQDGPGPHQLGKNPELLSTADESGRRVWVYPAEVRGKFRTARNAVGFVLLVVFLVLPWLRIQGRQAVHLDIGGGKLALFGLAFQFHDAPMLFFLIGGGAFTLAFVTAIWGRLWCGWACPQTVFVDQVFRRVERFLEGDSVKRRRQDLGPWTSDLILKKTLKWAAFLAISLGISHSFLAYFVGTEGLASMMASSPAQSPAAFGFMALMTAAVLFDFGWFREQFCTLICPYGRFQSVLMDEKSLAVSYDVARGEPRGIARLKTGGDCVDCRRCVQVCPTGIDIRNGLQLECVACTACIDACDQVMERLKRPKGLIRYTGVKGVRALLRPRVVALTGALALFLAGLSWTLGTREVLDVTLARAAGEPYSLITSAEGRKSVANRFRLEIRNQSWEEARVSIRAADGPASGSAGVAPENSEVRLIATAFPLTLASGKAQRLELFLTFPPERAPGGSGRAAVELKVEVPKLGQTHLIQREVPLVGPL